MIHWMMPVQFLQDARRRRAEPQRRLMAAVLQTVVDDVRGSAYRSAAGFPASKNQRTLQQARAYLASRDRTWPFSFENVCEAIGLDAAGVREELQMKGARE